MVTNKKKFIPIEKMTLGQKKVGLVKWLMKQGVSKEKAKLIAHNKYYHETRLAIKRRYEDN